MRIAKLASRKNT